MYKIVATKPNGKIKTLKENISFSEALDLIQLYESKDTAYVGFDLISETGFDDMVNKFEDDYIQPDHIEDDLIRDIQSKKRKQLKRFLNNKNLTESDEVNIELEPYDVKVAIADYLNVEPAQCEFMDNLPNLTIKIKR